ncbi:hypothetical protein AVI51_05370 [Piscirickettsia salmonis]|nr:hypothetical protein AVI48_00590 [Piscirickettsia salmonis]ERL61295.1 hypothetical protein K661_02370 [Piscirickettsia salmonis LF-89 = ATCC VR-1361]APS46376.1 hypothetical protein AVI49_01185 [Piscirickettsia salmonis]APS50344.1 hypothetical protein AVI50_05435 [Piscirickettsia salmonis]APS53543.1 hypothetical protein AVI51_05370 [Piscirickettsia salmonis]
MLNKSNFFILLLINVIFVELRRQMIKHIDVLNDHVLVSNNSFFSADCALRIRELHLTPLLTQGHKVNLDFEGIESINDEILSSLFKGLANETGLTEKELRGQLMNLNLDLFTSITARQYMMKEA